MSHSKEYLLGCLSNSILDSVDVDHVHVSELFSSVDHLKIVYELCQKYLSNHERHLSRAFSMDARIANELSPKTRVMSFTCAVPIAYKNPGQVFRACEKKWDFIAGLVDSYSILKMENQDLVLDILSSSNRLLEGISTWIREETGIEAQMHQGEVFDSLRFQFTNVLDFLGHKAIKQNSHVKWKEFVQKVDLRVTAPCYIYLKDEFSVLPQKARFSEVGYDVTIIRKHKQLNPKTALYDTGFSIQPPFGYYIEIVPRSSLAKTGYMMTNSIGIIDRAYQGNIFVSLTKVEEDAADLDSLLPFRCCQLIFRRQHFVPLEEKQFDYTTTTARGHGAYGSTGV